MGKRIGRKRLFALNKKGQKLTDSSGGGIKSSIGSQSSIRDGSLITTDFQIDLGNAADPCNSFSSAGNANGVAQILGVSSSAEPHDNAQITQFTVANNGFITSVELICVETPTGGENAIGLWYGSAVSGSDSKLDDAGAVQLIAATDRDWETVNCVI